jgi:hypothetical protein
MRYTKYVCSILVHFSIRFTGRPCKQQSAILNTISYLFTHKMADQEHYLVSHLLLISVLLEVLITAWGSTGLYRR